MESLKIIIETRKASKDQDASRVSNMAWAAVFTLAFAVLVLTIALGGDAVQFALAFLQLVK